MSDHFSQANSRAAANPAADTNGKETSSRRDFLRLGAGLVGGDGVVRRSGFRVDLLG